LASVLGFVGGYILFKKITSSREVKEWIALIRESKDILKKLLDEQKRRNGSN